MHDVVKVLVHTRIFQALSVVHAHTDTAANKPKLSSLDPYQTAKSVSYNSVSKL